MQIPATWVWSIVILAFSQCLCALYLAIEQSRQNARAFGVFQVALGMLIAALTWLGGHYGGWSWRAVIQAQVGAYVLGAVIAVAQLQAGRLLMRVRMSDARHALHFGVPLIPHVIGSTVVSMADKVILANLLGLQTSGLYEVGVQTSAVMRLVAISFHQAWAPKLFVKLKSDAPGVKAAIVRFTYLLWGALIATAFVIALAAKALIPFVLGSDYSGAAVFVLWMCLANAFNGMYSLVANFIFYAEKTHVLSATTLASGIVNLALVYSLVSYNGAVGAAQATALSLLIMFVMTWAVSARVYPMPWFQRRGLHIGNRAK
jgi:O-antigen/teichoic acid export membrane protein